MVAANKSIPLYSIDKFKRKPNPYVQFQVEEFDAYRHFEVEYPHRHDFFEILFLTRGTGIHTIDYKNYQIQPHTVFFLTPGQVHSIDVSEDVKGYIFLFTSEFYMLNKRNENKLLEFPFFYNVAQETPPLYLNESEDLPLLLELFQRGSTEMELAAQDSPEIVGSLLDLILLYCQRHYPGELTESGLSRNKLLVKRFKQLIEENYDKNYNVSDYASLLSVTANHLTETVRTVTGRTSTALINDKRIIEIKRLLMHTELTATEIAHAMNFKDQSYFSRFFKKQTGSTLNNFRQALDT